LTGSFGGSGSAYEWQTPRFYESDKMAPHVQAFAQSQTSTSTSLFPHHVLVSQPKSLLTQQLATHAAHPNFHVQGFNYNEMTIDPSAVSPHSRSPMNMHHFSPHSEPIAMGLDFHNFSHTTPAATTWYTHSAQSIPIPSTSRSFQEGVRSLRSFQRHIHDPHCSLSPQLPNSDLSIGAMSPMAEMSYLGTSSSYQGTSDVSGFKEAQIQAARNIQRFQLMHPGNTIPAALITSELAEIKEGRGWCLIGSCGLERENDKTDPTYNADTDKTRKRLDHLYDHIRDKHFVSRPHQCMVW
jgi:hypothetical protein